MLTKKTMQMFAGFLLLVNLIYFILFHVMVEKFKLDRDQALNKRVSYQTPWGVNLENNIFAFKKSVPFNGYLSTDRKHFYIRVLRRCYKLASPVEIVTSVKAACLTSSSWMWTGTSKIMTSTMTLCFCHGNNIFKTEKLMSLFCGFRPLKR